MKSRQGADEHRSPSSVVLGMDRRKVPHHFSLAATFGSTLPVRESFVRGVSLGVSLKGHSGILSESERRKVPPLSARRHVRRHSTGSGECRAGCIHEGALPSCLSVCATRST